MENQKQNKKQLNDFAKYSGIAIQMGLIIYLGSLLGAWVDKKYPTDGLVYGKGITLVAIFLAIYSVIKQVTSSDKE